VERGIAALALPKGVVYLFPLTEIVRNEGSRALNFGHGPAPVECSGRG
jgi:hypothetical protein